MKRVTRLLAGVGTAALAVGGAVVGLSAGTAQAAPQMTVTPNNNLRGGDQITVRVTGMPENVPVAVGICQVGREAKGPGDCAPSSTGGSRLLSTDASGAVTTQLRVVEGDVGNTSPPKYRCDADNPCEVRASTISGDTVEVGVRLSYADGRGGQDAAGSRADEAAAAPSGSGTDAGAVTSGRVRGGNGKAGAALSQTGPRETAITALVGVVLLQLGLIFAVRSARSAPRRTAL